MGIGNEEQTAIAFEGNWREFAPIALTNTLLTFATLGFYRFWATTRERQYLWSKTRFIDDSLEWTGTGLELFFGFLIALLAFGVPLFLINFVLQAMVIQGQSSWAGSIVAILYIGLFYLVGVAIFRGLRYRLSRTYWHGIHGGCDDNGLRFGWSYLWKTVVAYLCLALLFPWSMTALWKERWEAMTFGPHRFESTPQWNSLMGRYLIAYLSPFIILIGLVVVAIPMMMAAAGGSTGDASPTSAIFLGVGFVLAFYILLPLAALIYYAAYMREVVGTMTLSSIEFDFTARTKDWIKLFLGNVGLWIIAGAVAAVPIAAFGLFDQFTNLTPERSPFMSNPVMFIAFLVAVAIPFGIVADVQHLDEDGEGHGEIDVAFLKVNVEALGDERGADEQEEGQGKHLHRRMGADEVADRASEDHHEAHRD